MTGMIWDMKRFMIAAGQTVEEFNGKQEVLYRALIREESEEFLRACTIETEVDALKEAADILVVTLGWIISMGVSPDQLWKLVHENNMAKFEGGVVKDSNGKVQKSARSKARKEKMMVDIKELL